MTELLEVVRTAVATALERDPAAITPDARLREDLHADSLTLLEVAAIVADRTALSIPDEDLAGLRTVRDLADHCEALR